ncbi:MAG: hypothetical protein CMF31_03020 [Kordiimonas sp.]|nr:hypothetical protein [Kordiimonas sp.]|tara:strand:- start:537 stop:722 length:186 start_codon:yes stop_codon:yes gene_type:complete
MTELLVAFGLVLVLEGLLYALFPGGMKRTMAAALAQPETTIITMGVVAIAIGVLVVWLVKI